MRKPNFRGSLLLAATLTAFATPLASAQFANGIMGYWTFDGDLFDRSNDGASNGADGTFVPGTGPNQDLRFDPAKFGTGIFLNDFGDGSNPAQEQYVEITGVAEDTFDFTGGSMSVSLWVWSEFVTLPFQTIIAKGDGASWRLSRDDQNDSPAFFGGGGAPATGDPLNNFLNDGLRDINFDPDPATFHHIVAVAEAGVGLSIYWDGSLVGSAPGNVQLGDSTFPLTIGADPSAAADFFRAWEGIIDDVAIWDRPLTASEVALLYSNGTGISVGAALDPTDSDTDGMPDFYEDANGLNKADPSDALTDLDGDGLNNLGEFNLGSNPNNVDTDGDLIEDGEEATLGADGYITSPTSSDTDGDGLSDPDEIAGNNPSGFTSNPTLADTDGDTFSDKEEVDFGTDPNDDTSFPSRWQVGLKGYWPLDEASYLASDADPALQFFPDASGRGYHGVTAGASTTPAWFTGKFYPRCARLSAPASAQYIEILGSENEMSCAGGDLTVSAWFKSLAFNTAWQAIVAKGEGNNWRVHRQGGSNPGVLAFAGGTNDIPGNGLGAIGPRVDDFQWHHVAAVTEHGVETRLYVDGDLVATSTQAGIPAPNLADNGVAMQIGGNPDAANRNMAGLVEEVAVWGRVLDASEVSQIYLGGVGATITELIEGLDTDNDGLLDVFEDAFGLDKTDPTGDNGADGDPDMDGRTNTEERDDATHPTVADTDGDGLNDGDEATEGTDPLNPDSDGDGLTDGDELTGSQNPYLNNVFRENFDPAIGPAGDATDPTLADTDGDNRTDNVEVLSLTDPNDPLSFPLLPINLYYTFDEEDPVSVTNFGILATAGTVTGGVTYTDSYSPAFGKAFLGNRTGANDALIDTTFTGTVLGFAGNDYTASALVRWDGSSGGVDHMIFAQTRTNNALHHGIRADNGGTNDGHFGHWGNDINNAGTFPVGVWQHVAYSYLAGTAKVHINGVQVGTAGVGVLNATGAAENIVIGYTGRDGVGNHGSFNGAIDEVKVFARALTDGEILAEYNDIFNPSVGDSGPFLQILPGAYNAATGMLSVNVTGVPAGQTFHLRSSTTGQALAPLTPGIDFDDTTVFPVLVPVDQASIPKLIFQIFTGPSVP